MNIKFDINTKKIILIGDPMGHSLSSKVHNAIYRHYDVNAIYLPLQVKSEDVEDFFKAARLMQLTGINATMPHKTALAPYVDEVEDAAKAYNCVSTVVFDEHGKTHGYGFDGFGMCESVEAEGHRFKGKKVLVIGSGGITGITVDELARRGAAEIVILNRTEDKAWGIADLCAKRNGIPTSAGPLTREALDKAAADSSFVMQCTPLGMHGYGKDFDYLGFVDKLPDNAVVTDAIYNPRSTSILTKAQSRGLSAINGIGMLGFQMDRICYAFFGFHLDDEGTKVALKAMSDAVAGII